MKRFELWLRWAGTNSLAELIGLGATLALDFLVVVFVAAAHSIAAAVLSIILMTATGAIEGVVVGLLQWSVLRRPFPTIQRATWVKATVTGAVVAWFFGSLPSTLIDIGTGASDSAVQEPETLIVLLLAVAMGLLLGLVLAYPQWRVLRQTLPGAWRWLPANSAAWGLGMPAVFATIDVAQRAGSIAGTIIMLALGLLLSGAIVGGVHGLALLSFVSSRQERSKKLLYAHPGQL